MKIRWKLGTIILLILSIQIDYKARTNSEDMDLAICNKEEDEKRPSTRTRIPLVPVVSEYPWLMISHRNNKNKQILCNVSLTCHYTKYFSAMSGKRVRLCSCNGWCDAYEYSMCLLTAAPSEPNCFVIFGKQKFIFKGRKHIKGLFEMPQFSASYGMRIQ